eukprot:2529808-Karenia_brevis.AAC.1
MLKSAPSARRSINQRLHAPNGLPAVNRLQPAPKPQIPLWARPLLAVKKGFVCLISPAATVVLYTCSFKGQVWAMVLNRDLQSPLRSVFWLPADILFCDVFKQIHELMATERGCLDLPLQSRSTYCRCGSFKVRKTDYP